MANSVDPDEMAHNEPSHQDLHGMQKGPAFVSRTERVKPLMPGGLFCVII